MIRGNLEIKREDTPVVSPELADQKAGQEGFQNRRVYFRFTIFEDKAEFIVKDQGQGFDVASIPSAENPDSFKDGIDEV